MLTVAPRDLKAHVGRELEPSDWVTVDQAMIDKFADATGDHQWIHVDTARAKREMPGGMTIAHGYLTLSLLPQMIYQSYTITGRGRSINYGSDKVRFHGAGAGRIAGPPQDDVPRGRRHPRRRRTHRLGLPDGTRRRRAPGPGGRSDQRGLSVSPTGTGAR